jgi:two-component system, OmpR family, phosphate regulon response regulator PhoB
MSFPKPRILVVDDEREALELIEFNLKQSGFDVITATDGLQALHQARTGIPALVVLDLMLPEIDGLEVCKILRRNPATATLPIIMVTARAGEIDRVLGFEVGADDYITKPFSPRELVLRVKNVLKRAQNPQDASVALKFGPLIIDVSRHEVTWNSKRLGLTATEFQLLAFLAQRQGRVQSRDQLLRDVWHYSATVDSRTVDTHVRRLREKLGRASKYIKTIRGLGYRLDP